MRPDKHLCQYLEDTFGFMKEGFYGAFFDPEKGRVYAYNKDDDYTPVMPRDDIGNYFYLRSDGKIKYQETQKTADCNGKALNSTLNLTLIADVLEADPYSLQERMLNDLLNYEQAQINTLISNINRDIVVSQELRNLDPKNLNAALQRLKKQTIVSLNFELTYQSYQNNCVKCIDE